METNERRVKVGVMSMGMGLLLWMGMAMWATPEPTVYHELVVAEQLDGSPDQ